MKRIYILCALLITAMSLMAENCTIRFYGADCATPQTIKLPVGVRILIAPQSLVGHHFTRWSDGNTDNPRLITASQDSSFTAEFSVDYFTVSIDASPCSNPTKLIAPYGQKVMLMAHADVDQQFTQWTDGNTENPRLVTIGGDASYVAEFAQVSTDVEQVSAPSAASKFFLNGRLVIRRGDDLYDANGRKL